MWNELIKIKNNPEIKPMIKNQAALYLDQLNTAGNNLITREVEIFIKNNSK